MLRTCNSCGGTVRNKTEKVRRREDCPTLPARQKLT